MNAVEVVGMDAKRVIRFLNRLMMNFWKAGTVVYNCAFSPPSISRLANDQ